MKELDRKDKHILAKLFEDGRAPATGLAKAAGISKEVAAYRLQRMRQAGLFERVVPIVDFNRLGLGVYRLQLLLTPEGKQRKEEFVSACGTIQELSWLAELSGAWDFELLFTVSSRARFHAVYDAFLAEHGSQIEKRLTSLVFRVTHLSPLFLTGGERVEIEQGLKEKAAELSARDKGLVELLEEDGRMPLLAMAGRLHLSVSTVKYHLERLQKKRIILGFKPLLRLSLLGYGQFAVMIELADPSQRRRLRELLRINPHVLTITEAMGKYDLECEAAYGEVGELLEALEDIGRQVRIRKYDLIYARDERFVNGMPYGAMQRK